MSYEILLNSDSNPICRSTKIGLTYSKIWLISKKFRLKSSWHHLKSPKFWLKSGRNSLKSTVIIYWNLLTRYRYTRIQWHLNGISWNPIGILTIIEFPGIRFMSYEILLKSVSNPNTNLPDIPKIWLKSDWNSL